MKKILSVGLLFVASAAFISCGGEQKPAPHRTKVIAHRGYWKAEGSAQNSLASLRKAAEIGCYGSEFDVHLTADGVAIINHDNDWAGPLIQDLPASFFEDKYLANGEILPTLRQYLEEGAKYPEMKLILEVKSANNPEHESKSVEVIMDIVEETGLRDQVEYIAFSYHICKEILARDPSAPVAYLNGDKTVEQLVADGIPGLDYNLGIVRKDPEIFKRAREAGVSTNVWTVNKEEDMRFLVENKADYITTDQPELALRIVSETPQE